jgi:hypothetical protein
MSSFQISDGFVDIVCISEADGTRRMPDRVTRRQMGHIFAGVRRAGAASGAPTGRNAAAAEEVNRAISELKFEMEERANANANTGVNANTNAHANAHGRLPCQECARFNLSGMSPV